MRSSRLGIAQALGLGIVLLASSVAFAKDFHRAKRLRPQVARQNSTMMPTMVYAPKIKVGRPGGHRAVTDAFRQLGQGQAWPDVLVNNLLKGHGLPNYAPRIVARRNSALDKNAINVMLKAFGDVTAGVARGDGNAAAARAILNARGITPRGKLRYQPVPADLTLFGPGILPR